MLQSQNWRSKTSLPEHCVMQLYFICQSEKYSKIEGKQELSPQGCTLITLQEARYILSNFTQWGPVAMLMRKRKQSKKGAQFRECTIHPDSVSIEALTGCTSYSTCSGLWGLQGSSQEKSEKKCSMNILHLPLRKKNKNIRLGICGSLLNFACIFLMLSCKAFDLPCLIKIEFFCLDVMVEVRTKIEV